MGVAYFRNIYDYRELITALAAKEIKIKYKSAVLGWLWSLLNPLLLMVMFTLVFTYIIPVAEKNFPVFLLCALLPWFFLSFSLNSAATSIIDNSSLIKKAYFPYEVIPISVVMANLFNFLISFLLLFAFLFFFKIYPTGYILLLPLLVLLQSIFVLGVCLGVSALNTMFRDIKYAVELFLIIWFYATPVFYRLSDIPEQFRGVFYFNPLTMFVTLYRDILLYQRVPDFGLLALTLAVSIVSLVMGSLIFCSYKKYFSDVT
ncbi:MAG: ABC transporter permease [Candidatus Omnitrophota bacterium]